MKISWHEPEKLARLRRNSDTVLALELEPEEALHCLGAAGTIDADEWLRRARRRWRFTSRSAARSMAWTLSQPERPALEVIQHLPRTRSGALVSPAWKRRTTRQRIRSAGIVESLLMTRCCRIREGQRDQTAPSRIAARKPETVCGQRGIGVTKHRDPTAARRRRGGAPLNHGPR